VAKLDFPLSQLRQERTPSPFANQLVDVGNHVNRKKDMRSSAQILGHTYSTTVL